MPSLNPKDFKKSVLLIKSAQYNVPDKDEPRSKFSVSGFPTSLLNVIYYVLPDRLDGQWHKSISNVERFLLSVGIPLLDKATAGCQHYSQLMLEATNAGDIVRQDELKHNKFRYDMDDIKITGSRESGQGGTAIRSIVRDNSAIEEISKRLSRTGLSALVVIALVYALTLDTSCEVISQNIITACKKQVEDFEKHVKQWEEELVDL